MQIERWKFGFDLVALGILQHDVPEPRAIARRDHPQIARRVPEIHDESALFIPPWTERVSLAGLDLDPIHHRKESELSRLEIHGGCAHLQPFSGGSISGGGDDGPAFRPFLTQPEPRQARVGKTPGARRFGIVEAKVGIEGPLENVRRRPDGHIVGIPKSHHRLDANLGLVEGRARRGIGGWREFGIQAEAHLKEREDRCDRTVGLLPIAAEFPLVVIGVGKPGFVAEVRLDPRIARDHRALVAAHQLP